MTSDKFALATVEVQCRSSQQAFIERLLRVCTGYQEGPGDLRDCRVRVDLSIKKNLYTNPTPVLTFCPCS